MRDAPPLPALASSARTSDSLHSSATSVGSSSAVPSSDDILRQLWRCGRWQALNFNLLISLTTMASCWGLLVHRFVAADVPLTCANSSICFPENNSFACNDPVVVATTAQRDSIVSEWKLVCDRRACLGRTQLLFWLGSTLGALLLPITADQYGRKSVHLFCALAGALAGASLGTVTNLLQYAVIKCICGLLRPGLELTGVVWAIEFVPAKHRAVAGMLIGVYGDAFWILLALVAFLERHWRRLQIVVSLVPIVAIVLAPLVPESPIWLVSKNKFYTLKKAISRLANKVNKKSFPLKVIADCQEAAEADVFRSYEPTGASIISAMLPKRHYNILHIFRHQHLFLATVAMGFTWFVCDLQYLSLDRTDSFFLTEPYLDFLLLGLLELVSHLVGVFLVYHFGRQRPLALHMAIGSLAFIVARVIVPKTSGDTHWSVVGLEATVKGNMCIVRTALMVFVIEMFPTTVRMSGLGLVAAIGHCSAFVTPYLPDPQSHWLPGAFLGTAGLLAALLLVGIFPETASRPLPDYPVVVELPWHPRCWSWFEKKAEKKDAVGRMPVAITVEDWDQRGSSPVAEERM